MHGSALNPLGGRRLAFTAMEVMLALAVSGLIALCVMGLVGASSGVWQHTSQTLPGLTAGARAQSYMERTLRIAHEVGYWASGDGTDPPALLLWAHDLRSKQPSETRDHEIQGCELLLVRYDSIGNKLRLYVPIDWTGMTSNEQTEASEIITAASFNTKAAADTFIGRSWVESHVLAGALDGEQVTEMWVDVDRTGDNPLVRFRMTLAREGQTMLLHGAVRLRVPSQADDWAPLVLQNPPPQDGDDEDGDPFGF